MKAFSHALYLELEQQLQAIHQKLENPIQYSEQAILVLIAVLEKLKSFLRRYKFRGRLEEMDFFRNIKPSFASRLIFYNDIYNIESGKTFGTDKAIRKFYNAEVEKLKVFASDNVEFYRYYRKGSTHLDAKYFVRGQHDIRLTLDSFYFQADHGFLTSHDYKVARFMANDMVRQYLDGEPNWAQYFFRLFALSGLQPDIQ